ncbi:transposable element Tcb2 transposase [Trichonephila clavata]|uniref:Transposable element Tcb2 transposase n=1 Tax=Trichonephila clavata TaxID=2740835 RepID=A0A8X6GST0_TRICU|nr:transposable element Tcb2 transposase [Trichonephila clavata]
MNFKILLQKIWVQGFDWNEIISLELKMEFENLVFQISYLKDVFVPRKYFENCNFYKDISLHIFCDASESAYGTVAYFRYCDKNSDIKTNFIVSKTRVAPLKKLSLPRLELMGAIVAARLYKYLSELFRDVCSAIHLCSNSSIVLYWIPQGRQLIRKIINRCLACKETNFSAPVNQKKRDVNKPDRFPSAATLVSTYDRNGTGKRNL